MHPLSWGVSCHLAFLLPSSPTLPPTLLQAGPATSPFHPSLHITPARRATVFLSEETTATVTKEEVVAAEPEEAPATPPLTPEEQAVLDSLLEKAPPSMAAVWRRADFWVNETATFLEIVNVLGRFDTCSEWIKRTEFTVWEDSRAEDPRQAETLKR